MTFVSYAQNQEDVLLWRALRHVGEGFYIDVGANDPVEHSVTKAFYDRGWHGVNIEPLSRHQRRLCEERPRDINLAEAAGADDGELVLFDVPEVAGLATSDAEAAEDLRTKGYHVMPLTVPVRTLTTICEELAVGEIHFLKVDVEGAEAEVLGGMDLARWRPWILVVEATAPETQVASHEEWEQILMRHRYQFAHFDGLNRYYVSGEHKELVEALATQPNVFDDFITAHQLEATEAAQQAEAELAAIRASLSWRYTRPLRWLRRMQRLVLARRTIKAQGASFLRSFGRRLAGRSLGWILARRRLRGFLIWQVTRFPHLHSIARVTFRKIALPTRPRTGPLLPERPEHMPVSAREVLRTLDEARQQQESRQREH
jgi:FkbM family methyltransferase